MKMGMVDDRYEDSHAVQVAKLAGDGVFAKLSHRVPQMVNVQIEIKHLIEATLDRLRGKVPTAVLHILHLSGGVQGTYLYSTEMPRICQVFYEMNLYNTTYARRTNFSLPQEVFMGSGNFFPPG